jgi:8-oxo-dGTP pyrophosphatase MutT (NUDIX family)
VTASGAPKIEIAALDRTEIVFEPWSWRFASERRDEIDRHFAEIQRRRAGVWNGRILLMQRHAIAGGVLRGACFEADYASFCAWRDWKFPDTSVQNVFAVAALRSADGAFVLGEMAASTFNAGLVTFPCGTPEPADLDAAGALDLGANLGRELVEETGLPIGELAPEPGWTMVRDRCYLALVRQVVAPLDAEALRAQIVRNLARQQAPEFVGIRLARSERDLDAALPAFIRAYLRHIWS